MGIVPEQIDHTGDSLARPQANDIPAQPVDVSGQSDRKRRYGSPLWNNLKADYGRVPRALAAFAVLIWCIGNLLLNNFSVCKDETVIRGIEASVTYSCGGPSVTDAGVIAFGLLIILFFLPDMSEIGVFGISLKRRLAEAEAKAAESKAKAEYLENQVHIQNSRIETLSQNLVSASAQANGNAIYFGDEFVRVLIDDLPNKADAYKRGVEPDRTKFSSDFSPRPSEDGLVTQLIRNWERIAASLNLPPSRRRKSDTPRIVVNPDEANRFINVFADELDVVRAARNSVAHAIPISSDELRAAVGISERLLEILQASR